MERSCVRSQHVTGKSLFDNEICPALRVSCQVSTQLLLAGKG